MKKIVFALLAVIIVAIALVYILIPNNFIVSTIVYTNNKPAAILRCLHDDNKWQQWMPGKTDDAKKFSYNNYVYDLIEKSYTSIDILITKNDKRFPSEINVLPINADSSAVQWKLEFTAGNNPFKRIEAYQRAKNIKNNITALLDSFKTFTQSTKNIYGIDITRTTLTDTTLVSIKASLKNYPSTDFIYELVSELKEYINQQHASEHNYPMLNITLAEDGGYNVMVGIPTNIPLDGNHIIQPKRMIMLKNKTLVTEVTGDTSIINEALKALNNYMHDYELSAPVIPFQQLVTDRSKEKDSTRWVTKIFTPVS